MCRPVRLSRLWIAVSAVVVCALAVSAVAGEKHPEYSDRLKAMKKVLDGRLEVPEVPSRTDENAEELNRAMAQVRESVAVWPTIVNDFVALKDERVFKELFKSLKRLEKTTLSAQEEYEKIQTQLQAAWNARFIHTEEFYRQEGRFPQSIRSDLKAALGALGPKAERLGIIWNGYLRTRKALEQGMRTNLALMGDAGPKLWKDVVKTAVKAKNAEDRAAFALALGRFGGDDAEKALLDMEKNAKGEVDTVFVMRGLADMRSEAGLERIVERLADEKSPFVVRMAAVRALKLYRHPDAIPSLAKALDTADGRLLGEIYDTLFDMTGIRRAEAAMAWQSWWREKGEAFLKRWSSIEAERQAEIERITFLDPRQYDVAAELAALYRNEPTRALRLEILESLSLQRSYYARMTLLDALRGDDRELRIAAIRALGRYRHLAVPAALMERVQAVDPDTEEGREELQELFTALKKLWSEDDFTVSSPDKERLLQWWDTNKGRVADQLIRLAGGNAIAGRPTSDQEGSPWQGRDFYGLQIRSNRVLFIVDVSFSMDEPANEDPNLKKIDVAKKELKRAIQGLPNGGTFGIIFFSHKTYQQPDRQLAEEGKDLKIDFGPGLVEVNKKNKERALEWIDSVRTGASTNIYDPLELAFKYGRDPDVIKECGKLAPDTIFLVSDGAPTSGKFTDVEVIQEHVQGWNRTGRITVNTIGVGKDQDIAFLRALAEDNGGRYTVR